jgi:hypothetical protein
MAVFWKEEEELKTSSITLEMLEVKKVLLLPNILGRNLVMKGPTFMSTGQMFCDSMKKCFCELIFFFIFRKWNPRDATDLIYLPYTFKFQFTMFNPWVTKHIHQQEWKPMLLVSTCSFSYIISANYSLVSFYTLPRNHNAFNLSTLS